MTTNTAQAAVKTAITAYAISLGVSFDEAVNLFKTDKSTRDCISLLVLAQADKEGLAKLAA